ncbi:CBS domain-containing protein [Roseinatronobacter alkalisoli]|uniref:CBS domain-containing protein n=1 Tax=Roseinatronobacter alkalisoli TaxID=3028235 RepID=A0ABT5T627_9RHOB|nr:CBS domain-containing protein [Roseinatronobacter sp. HJB301]MDD7970175.1 CBS domain-containing protein [Roseinatronobacter sp. HJB301]
MLVSQILRNKENQTVLTVVPGTTISEAVRVLSENRIGALVISPDGKKVSGILSERDIVRELGRRGPVCMSDKVDDVMTRNVYGCNPDDSADLVLQTMTQKRFRHIPVMDGDQMLGLISIGDVVAARMSELELEKDALTGMIMGY